MTRLRPWCRTPPRNSVLWSPREPVSTSPSWCPRRCAPGPGPTPGRSRNLWSRSGATFLLRNLVLLKRLIDTIGRTDSDMANNENEDWNTEHDKKPTKCYETFLQCQRK